MTKNHWTRSQVIVGLSLIALGIGIACSQIDSPRSLQTSRASAVRATLNSRAISRTEIASTMPHLDRALTDEAWIGEMHNAMVTDLLRENPASSHPTPTSACRSALRWLMAHRDQMREKAHSSMSDRDYGFWMLRAVSGDKHCERVSVMSLFGMNKSLDAVLSASTVAMDDTLVTDAGIALANTVATAIGNASGYPADVAAAADAALANAPPMSAVDYSMGEAVANVGLASSNQFLSLATSGMLDSTRYQLLSLFRPYGLLQWYRIFLNPIVRADAIGCAAFMSVAGAMQYNRENMGIICLAGAGVASGLFVIFFD